MDELGRGRGPLRDRRATIPATCGLHRGPMGFANLLVHRRDGGIALDAHATGMCLIILDEDAARILRDTLTDWFGRRERRRSHP